MACLFINHQLQSTANKMIDLSLKKVTDLFFSCNSIILTFLPVHRTLSHGVTLLLTQIYFFNKVLCAKFSTLLTISVVSYLTTREAAWYIILVVSVCQMRTFESLGVVSSYLHIRYISLGYTWTGNKVTLVYEGHWVKVKSQHLKKVPTM